MPSKKRLVKEEEHWNRIDDYRSLAQWDTAKIVGFLKTQTNSNENENTNNEPLVNNIENFIKEIRELPKNISEPNQVEAARATAIIKREEATSRKIRFEESDKLYEAELRLREYSRGRFVLAGTLEELGGGRDPIEVSVRHDNGEIISVRTNTQEKTRNPKERAFENILKENPERLKTIAEGTDLVAKTKEMQILKVGQDPINKLAERLSKAITEIQKNTIEKKTTPELGNGRQR